MNIYRADINWMQNQLTNIASSNQTIASHQPGISHSLENIHSNFETMHGIFEKGFENAHEDLESISYQLDELIDVTKTFSDQQFIQNEERNQLLASIDATLKAPNKTAAQEKFEIGQELANRGKLDHAISMLVETIELNPLHYRAYLQLVTFSMQKKDYKQAFDYAKESIIHAPEGQTEIIAHNHYLIARTYSKNKQYDEALIHIEKAIELKFKGEYQYEKAIYCVKLNQREQAIEALREAIIMDYKYFAQSLIDSNFHHLHKERDELLSGMKERQKDGLEKKLSTFEDVQFPDYPFQERSELQLDPMNISLNYFSPNGYFNQQEALYAITVQGIRNEDVPYSYNSFVKTLNQYLTEFRQLHQNGVNRIKQFLNQNSYASFCQGINAAYQVAGDFNHFKSLLVGFFASFFTHRETFAEYLQNEEAATNERISEMKKKIKESKRENGIFLLFKKEEREFINDDKELMESYREDLEKVKQAMIDAPKEYEAIENARAIINDYKLPVINL